MGIENIEDLINDDVPEELGDPSVPEGLLDLHVELEEAGVTPEEFKEVYGS